MVQKALEVDTFSCSKCGAMVRILRRNRVAICSCGCLVGRGRSALPSSKGNKRKSRLGSCHPSLKGLGAALRALRLRRGLTQWQLACKLAQTRGKTPFQSDVAMVEQGVRNLTWVRLLAFCQCLGCTMGELVALVETGV